MARVKAPAAQRRGSDGHTVWSIHTLEYYSARNRSEAPPVHTTVWRDMWTLYSVRDPDTEGLTVCENTQTGR